MPNRRGLYRVKMSPRIARVFSDAYLGWVRRRDVLPLESVRAVAHQWGRAAVQEPLPQTRASRGGE